MTKGDKLLVVFIVLLSVFSFGYINRFAFSTQEKYVSVQVSGQEIKKILYDEQLIGHSIPVDTDYGHSLLELGDDQVRFLEADCPDQICIQKGYISRIGETIVCLPNRLVIEIKGEQGEDDIDVINY